jgi:hypothetical protein
MSDRPRLTIVGGWVLKDGEVVGDQATRIIRHLVADHFIEVSEREGGWTTLHLDPTDGSYWELTYPQSEMHGAGPPALARLSADEVWTLYGIEPREEHATDSSQ